MHTNKLEEKKHDNPPKLKQKAADLSDTGVISDQATGQGAESLNGEQHEDSFQRMYSKELDLDEDEVPIILHELNDSAIHFISRDQYERALSLLQKAQTLIDVFYLIQLTKQLQRLQFQRNPNDRFIVLLTMHNMALCFQKLGALEECAICLEASLQSINSPFLIPKFQGDPSRKLKKLKYECKAHMQVCALLSQLHRHKEALIHAEKSVMIAQYMVNDLLSMCQFYQGKILAAKKNEQIAQELMMIDDPHQQNPQNKDLIYYDDSISMLERTAYRILPIIQEVASRMIRTTNEDLNERKKNTELSDLMKQKLNMKAVLGYLNQSEWLYLLNIGNIMQITPLTVHDLYSNQTFEVELTRDAILEKISFLAVSYFCMSTELRFLVQVKDDPTIDPILKKKESEYWHAKALEISCSFLPSESPLVSHILTSYQKHHAPVQHEIPEDQEQLLDLKVIRPIQGIDICKYQPMVRQDEALNISIPQLPLSPNNYANKRRQSIDNKTTQILSLPFSPNNQGTTANASQNNLFSSQLGQKIQTTDSSTSNLVPSQRQTSSTNNGGNSSINLQQQQQQKGVNRFNKNRISGQGNKKNTNNPPQFTNISNDGIEVNQQVLEDIDDNDDQNTQFLLTNDQGNRSMMDIVPSQNYKKLLNDFSNIQNSTDILEELDDDEIQRNSKQNNKQNSQLIELGQEEIVSDNDDENDFNNNNKHQESQEVEIVMEEMNKRRKKHQQIIKSGSSNSAQRRGVKNAQFKQQQQDISQNLQLQQNYNRAVQNRSQLQNQILDISQDQYIQDDDDSQEDDSLDEDQFFEDDTRGSHSRSKQQLRMQNNLSMDGARIRRPQTSQGIRKNFKQINHHNMIHHTDSNNTMRQQQNYNTNGNNIQQQQLQDLNMIKANTALGMIPSADGVSPNNAIIQRGGILGNRQIHNQSAAAVSGKISKNQTFANGFNMSNSISGNQTDIQNGSTPVKSGSIGGRGNKGSAKYNRENMNMSRANLDSRTYQSSSIDQMQQHQQRPNSKQKRLRNIQDQNNSAGQSGINQNTTNTTNPLIANQMPQITAQPSNKRSIQGALTQQQQQVQNNNLVAAHTQLNSHNHSQMIVINNNNNANVATTTGRGLNNGSNTVQGFYNSQQQQHHQQRSNSQTKKQHLSYSGGKQRGTKQNMGNTSDGFKQQNQQLQMQLIQQQQSLKYMTAGGIDQQSVNNNNSNSIQQNQKTLQDLFMIDRLVKKRGTNNNTHEQTNNNKSFEMIVNSATNNTDPKYNSQHLHNSNSRSKSRSKLTTSRSKDKHQSASGTINNLTQQQKLKQNNMNSGIFLKNPNGTNINQLNTQSVLNTSNSILMNGQNSLLDIQSQQQQQQSNIEELKRQILLKQALLDSSKNSRRKSTGNLNTSASLGNNPNQIQLTQQKKRIENVNQSIGQQQSNSLQQTQQNTQQQCLSAQLSGQKQSNNVNSNNNIVNTHQMIKKFLKDRQGNQQQSSSLGSQQQLLNNSLLNQVPQPLIANNNQIFSLNNSMLENYPINNQSQQLQNNNKNNNCMQQPNLFAPDLRAYKMQLSKKIMQQQQKLLGQSQQDSFQLANGSNGTSKRQGGKKSGNGQYITESHPKQQQRSATPVFEMYDSVNGQSRTQKQITQSNSLGMYMSNNMQQQPLQKKDKSLVDIGNFHIQNSNNNNNNQQNLAQYLKDYQSVQQQQDFQNQSLREDSFIKSMKKKNSKKTTPKNVINNQFSIV